MAKRPALLHIAYLIAIVIKGFDGLVETVAGLLIAIYGSSQVYEFAVWLTAPEIARHPESHAVHAIRHGAYGLAHSSHRFAIVYLLAHGILKLGLVINLLIEHLWIFPVSITVLLGFIAFMAAKLAAHWSPWLCAFAMFDLLTVALIANEWRVRWAQRTSAS
jgi:uncharacterized membrane protein